MERCLEHLRGLKAPRVLDVGVGSGAIALALADEHPGARVTAVDNSQDALALARENLAGAGVDGRVELFHGDLLGGRRGPVRPRRLEPAVRLAGRVRDASAGDPALGAA